MTKKQKKKTIYQTKDNNQNNGPDPETLKEFTNFFNDADDYYEKSNNMAKYNENLSNSFFGELYQAHRIALSVIWALVKKGQKPGKTDQSISDRLVLVASFIQGIDLCQSTINSGLYTQASALLKQELETLAAIEEINQGKRMINKTPNVSNVKWKLSEYYGLLNQISHVANHKILNPIYNGKSETVLEEAIPVAVLPTYNQELSIKLYSFHVCLLLQLCSLMAALHEEQHGEGTTIVQNYLISDAVNIILESGFMRDLNQKVESD
ncbi:hypothetical protein [Niallia endozanthoxylica]|uniref:Uncharacterized protein n=1 Tax=Niallia endozanthoxylica TaxID=2036016 RepID=A0A5J5HPA0_9BACI|nr:hypothetical protein [Niallia endozanthoxylica]KAA9023554.1 hypothetical protein F4V44_12870 [Niallia endozanthoxylica]